MLFLQNKLYLFMGQISCVTLGPFRDYDEPRSKTDIAIDWEMEDHVDG